MCDLSALIRRDKSGKHPLFFLLLPLLLAKHAAVVVVWGNLEREYNNSGTYSMKLELSSSKGTTQTHDKSLSDPDI